MNECDTVELCTWLACILVIHMGKGRGESGVKRRKDLEYKNGVNSYSYRTNRWTVLYRFRGGTAQNPPI